MSLDYIKTDPPEEMRKGKVRGVDWDYSFLKIETIRINKKYALTISPDDRSQFFEQGADRIRRFKEYWESKLSLWPCNFELNMEISSKGRLHFHGFISWDKPSEIMDTYVSYVNWLCKVSQIKMEIPDAGWTEYINKQKLMFSRYRIETTAKVGLKNMNKINGLGEEVLYKTLDKFF